ncbi:hypothetical protein H6F61_04210 [Cyanobacteria bacterium FACHB-472]|nr:hypothetical protein [Cyanobacteria bacterium FACHB-472]
MISYDQFAKDYLKELLTPLGEVETSRNIAGEVREIDVWFIPTSTPQIDAQALRILGQFAATSAIFEPFRNAVTPSQIRSCMSKMFDVNADLERQTKRENTRSNEAELPKLWILSPTASIALLDGFRAIPDDNNWLPGIYFLGDSLKTAIVAIHQLPRTNETLWVRVLAKGTVQKQAINELAQLPESNPFRANALELLYNLRLNLEANRDLAPEDRELIMELAPLYRQQMDAAVQQGIQQGVQQGQRVVVENVLRVRFGVVDEELAAIIELLLELPPEEFSALLLQLSQLSRDELLARFGIKSI